MQKIPQQFILHTKPLDLIGLLGHNGSWRGVFPRPSFGPGEDAVLQLSFFPTLPLKQPFYHLLIPKAVVFCNLPLCFSLCQHGLDLRQQRLNVCVNRFSMTRPPDVVCFPTSGGLVMEKRNYTRVQALLPEIKAMLTEGKTQREVAEYDGFQDKQVAKRLLERERGKERKLEAGILPRPKGRPSKDADPRAIVAEQAYEIQRLRMETTLLRDFLHCTGRR